MSPARCVPIGGAVAVGAPPVGLLLSLGVGVLVLFAQCSSFVALVVVQKRVLELYPVAVVVG